MTTGVCHLPKHMPCEGMSPGYEAVCCCGGVVLQAQASCLPAELSPQLTAGCSMQLHSMNAAACWLQGRERCIACQSLTAAPPLPYPLQGFVYLKFADANGAAAAQRALHGRFFAGRQLSAEFQFLHPYNQHFRC